MAITVGFMSLVAEQLWNVIPASPYFASVEALGVTAGCILFGGLIAFLMVWVEFSVIAETSALTFMVAGTFKEIVTGGAFPHRGGQSCFQVMNDKGTSSWITDVSCCMAGQFAFHAPHLWRVLLQVIILFTCSCVGRHLPGRRLWAHQRCGPGGPCLWGSPLQLLKVCEDDGKGRTPRAVARCPHSVHILRLRT